MCQVLPEVFLKGQFTCPPGSRVRAIATPGVQMPSLQAECLPPALEPKRRPSGGPSGLKPMAADPCCHPPPGSVPGRPGALGADGQPGPGVCQGRLKQLAPRGQPLLPPNPKLNAKPHRTGRPHPRPDRAAPASRAAGTAAHPRPSPAAATVVEGLAAEFDVYHPLLLLRAGWGVT